MKKKHKMKIILIFVLSLLLIFSFGCENEEANPNVDDEVTDNETDTTPDDSDILGGPLTDFQTLDFDDNEITEEVFEDNDVNLMFVWKTG
jgi:hypothetical protein